MRRPRLKSVEVLAEHQLRLCFFNGAEFDLDFRPLIAESKGLEPLSNPAVFALAQLIPGEGWEVTWPEVDIQIGADTLWLDAQAASAKA